MAYRIILPTSEEWVRQAEAALGVGGLTPVQPPVADADRAEKTLRADYGRISRWLFGLAATVGAAVSGVIFAFAVTTFADAATDPLAIVFGWGTLAVAVAIGLPSVWLLIALHRSGKRLSRATGYWAALPYQLGVRAPAVGDEYAVRYAVYSFDLFPRVATSALALLASVFAVSMIFYSSLVKPDLAGLVIAITWSILAVSVTIGQFWGVQRIQNGLAWRSPQGYERRMRRLRRG